MIRLHAAALLLLAVLTVVLPFAVGASDSAHGTIAWQVLSAGGAPGASGHATLNGSIGQPAVGPASSGSSAVGSGFWVQVFRNYIYYLPSLVDREIYVGTSSAE